MPSNMRGIINILLKFVINCDMTLSLLQQVLWKLMRFFILSANAIKANQMLKDLFLGDNKLVPSDGQCIGAMLKNNTTLRLLDLRNNGLQVSQQTQSVHQAISQSVSLSVCQWVSGWVSQSVSRSDSQSVNNNNVCHSINQSHSSYLNF